mmetsp:Transcript_14510/g.22041  ORF Transcript_14510/g.22041 Transcript_14510/m.22041 type:complete len:483 (-) Transcript_14510:154-1602(-)
MDVRIRRNNGHFRKVEKNWRPKVEVKSTPVRKLGQHKRVRRKSAALSPPTTPPHSKRARYEPPSSLEYSGAFMEEDEGKDGIRKLISNKMAVSVFDPQGSKKLLLATIQFLRPSELYKLALCSRYLYEEPAIWKTYCMRILPLPSRMSWKVVSSSCSLNQNSEAKNSERKISEKYRLIASRRHRELAYVPAVKSDRAVWLDKNPGLRSRFFPILVNWLVDLHLEIFRLHSSRRRTALAPVHAAVKHLYMFLSNVGGCQSQGLQKVGVACYYLSLRQLYPEKMLEKMGVNPAKFAYFTDEAYTPEEIDEMTSAIATSLPSRMDCQAPPTAILMLDKILSRVEDIPTKIQSKLNRLVITLAFNIVDLSIHEDVFAKELPTCIACGALLAALTIVARGCDEMLVDVREEDAIAIAGICCAPVQLMRMLSKQLLKLFQRAKRRETRQIMPYRSVSASFYWTVIDRYRRQLLNLAAHRSGDRRKFQF